MVLCAVSLASVWAHCCQCGGGKAYGKTPWDIAKLHATGATVIFEGTPERLDLRWAALDAKEGDLIPVYTIAPDPMSAGAAPHLVVTFQVQRTYKGNPGPKVIVSTGLGGGDCGARYTPGITYLLYLSPGDNGEFGTSMCSPGGWIENSEVAPDLRYLRGERPAPADLRPYRRESELRPKERAAEVERRRLQYEAWQRNLTRTTGKICGIVLREGAKKDDNAGSVYFLSTLGYLPGEPPFAEVKGDGSFCSGPLGAGKYYLHYTGFAGEKMTSSLDFPSVTDRAKATVIEVTAAQTQSNIVFKVPKQQTYSVRGLISANDSPERSALGVSVLLLRDGEPRVEARWTDIHFESSFPFPKIRYFSFGNVFPGRYLAYVSGPGPGWFTRKTEVVVTTHSRFIFLDLLHKK